jgi:hypothetical protein
MWSTVQAAITGGWGTTARLSLILTIILVLIAALRHGPGALISALIHRIQ